VKTEGKKGEKSPNLIGANTDGTNVSDRPAAGAGGCEGKGRSSQREILFKKVLEGEGSRGDDRKVRAMMFLTLRSCTAK